MHAELLSSLAAEHRRDLTAGPRRPRVPAPGYRDDLAAVSSGPARLRTRHAPRALPGLRISWSRATLAGGTGRGRSRSWVIVISATRTL